MSKMPVRGGRPLIRRSLIALAALVLLLPLGFGPAVDNALAACPGAHVKPRGDDSLRKMRSATRCLINARRSGHGMRSVRGARGPRRAALGHARSMARHNYFSHTGRDGSTPADRVRRTGYPKGSWAVAEVIAWGKRRGATPARTVKRWMRSPGHRDVILNGRYPDLGVGVYGGCPCGGDRRSATYVLDFGHR